MEDTNDEDEMQRAIQLSLQGNVEDGDANDGKGKGKENP
jgi:hypothetical protein